MYPFSIDELLGGPQAISDVAFYIEGLEMTTAQAYPAVHSQHYNYLLRQLTGFDNGKRRNSTRVMLEALKGFNMREFKAASDYMSRMPPVASGRSEGAWQDPLPRER
jgi:cytochrome c553